MPSVSSHPSVSSEERARREGATGRPLALRVATVVVGAPIVLYAVWVGGMLWLALASLTVGLGLFEFYRMMRAKGLRPYRVGGGASGILLVWRRSPVASLDTNLLFAVILLALMTSELLRGHEREQDHGEQ